MRVDALAAFDHKPPDTGRAQVVQDPAEVDLVLTAGLDDVDLV